MLLAVSAQRRGSYGVIVATGDDADEHGTGSDGPPPSARGTARFRAWKRAFVIFGVTTILVIVLFAFLSLGAAPSHGKPAAPQSGQTLVVIGLIFSGISALGTLLSGWGTLMEKRAMARQSAARPPPRARAKQARPRIRRRS
jgi:hypothetical protein